MHLKLQKRLTLNVVCTKRIQTPFLSIKYIPTSQQKYVKIKKNREILITHSIEKGVTKTFKGLVISKHKIYLGKNNSFLLIVLQFLNY